MPASELTSAAAALERAGAAVDGAVLAGRGSMAGGVAAGAGGAVMVGAALDTLVVCADDGVFADSAATGRESPAWAASMADVAMDVWADAVSADAAAGNAGRGGGTVEPSATRPASALTSLAVEPGCVGLDRSVDAVALLAAALGWVERLLRPAPAAMARADLVSSGSGFGGGAGAAGTDVLSAEGVGVCAATGAVVLPLAVAVPLSCAAAAGGVASTGTADELPAGPFAAGVTLSSAGTRTRVAVTSVLEASIASAPSCIGGTAVAAVLPGLRLVWAGAAAGSAGAVTGRGMDSAAAATSALPVLPGAAEDLPGSCAAWVLAAGSTGRDDCEPGGSDDAAVGLLADAGFGRAAAAGVPVSAVRVGGTAANAALGGAVGAVVLGAVDGEPVLLDDCASGFVVGGGVLAAPP